jgi:alpha-ketoglutaric semialdehyde dehydrogenase
MNSRVTSVIDGAAVSGGQTLPSTNPARLDEVVAEVAFGDASTFVGAAESAKKAQESWAAIPAPIRGRAIAHIGRLVEDNAEALARLVTAEIGKPYGEALGEVREIIDTCDFFLGEGRRLYGQTVPSEMPDKQLFTFRRPVGTVAVITAGNFPVAVPSWYIVPALLAGNTVVWKPAEYSAASSAAFHQLFVRGGGLPDGVFNVVHADGAATFSGLEQALEAGLLDKVGFTGSSAVGREIGALTGRYLQTACLELGGKNPLVVTPSADLDLAVEGALFSGFGTAGQRCTSLGTVIVHESVHDQFLARFNAAVASAPVGDPTQDVLMGPMMDEKFTKRFEEFLGWIQPHHAVQAAYGKITADNPRDGFVGDPSTGLYYHPVVVDGVRPGDRIFMEETFGPIVGIATYQSLNEAIEFANAPGYGLAA